MKNTNQLPDLRQELKEMRCELGLLKTAFSLLNDPAVYYSTARAIELYSVSHEFLLYCASQGLISPVHAGRKIGWSKEQLDELMKTEERTGSQERLVLSLES